MFYSFITGGDATPSSGEVTKLLGGFQEVATLLNCLSNDEKIDNRTSVKDNKLNDVKNSTSYSKQNQLKENRTSVSSSNSNTSNQPIFVDTYALYKSAKFGSPVLETSKFNSLPRNSGISVGFNSRNSTLNDYLNENLLESSSMPKSFHNSLKRRNKSCVEGAYGYDSLINENRICVCANRTIKFGKDSETVISDKDLCRVCILSNKNNDKTSLNFKGKNNPKQCECMRNWKPSCSVIVDKEASLDKTPFFLHSHAPGCKYCPIGVISVGKTQTSV